MRSSTMGAGMAMCYALQVTWRPWRKSKRRSVGALGLLDRPGQVRVRTAFVCVGGGRMCEAGHGEPSVRRRSCGGGRARGRLRASSHATILEEGYNMPDEAQGLEVLVR